MFPFPSCAPRAHSVLLGRHDGRVGHATGMVRAITSPLWCTSDVGATTTELAANAEPIPGLDDVVLLQVRIHFRSTYLGVLGSGVLFFIQPEENI